MLATVFGDVHDIGKSLVNTILTNNGYTVVDLGKQVPIGTILDAAKEHDATAIGLSALLVSTSKQMPLCVQELHSQGSSSRCWSAAPRSTASSAARALPRRQGVRRHLRARRLLLQGRLRGPGRDGPARRRPRRASELVAEVREDARKLREEGEDEVVLDTADDSVRSPVATDNPVPEPPFWGVREIAVDLDEVYPHLDTHVLFKLHWGGRGVKGEAWRRAHRGRLPAAPRAHVARGRTTCTRARCSATSPATARATRSWCSTRRTARRCSSGSWPRASPTATASAWPTSSAPRRAGELDVVALQAVTAGDEVTELMAQLEKDGEFAEQLFTHGLGVQTAEGMAEWLHWRVRRDLGIPATQGRRYSWGYPAIPEQSEHEKVYRLLDATERIGLRLSGGFAVEPEQSTLALVAHHPQAIYFGTTSGRLLPDGHRGRPTTSSRARRATPRASASSTTPIRSSTRPRARRWPGI